MKSSHLKKDKNISFAKITAESRDPARRLILEGFRERFGFIDPTLNPDLADPVSWYSRQGLLFLTGSLEGQIVCTGAVTYEEEGTARIERMSVKKEYRRQGLAARMLLALERSAFDMGYRKIVLETNRDWESAVQLYLVNGYAIIGENDERFHFRKELDAMEEK